MVRVPYSISTVLPVLSRNSCRHLIGKETTGSRKKVRIFFPILARARNGETVCLSNSKKGERGDQRGSIKLEHTQWIRKRSNFSSDHVAHFYSPSPPFPISNRPLPISTLATPVRQQSTCTVEFLCVVAGEKRKFSSR